MISQKASTNQLFEYISKFGTVETAKIAYVIMEHSDPLQQHNCIAQLYQLTLLELEQQTRSVLRSEGYWIFGWFDDNVYVNSHVQPQRPPVWGDSLGTVVERLLVSDKEYFSKPSLKILENFVASLIHPSNL